MKNTSLLEPLYETMERLFLGNDQQEELEEQPLITEVEAEEEYVVIRSSN